MRAPKKQKELIAKALLIAALYRLQQTLKRYDKDLAEQLPSQAICDQVWDYANESLRAMAGPDEPLDTGVLRMVRRMSDNLMRSWPERSKSRGYVVPGDAARGKDAAIDAYVEAADDPSGGGFWAVGQDAWTPEMSAYARRRRRLLRYMISELKK